MMKKRRLAMSKNNTRKNKMTRVRQNHSLKAMQFIAVVLFAFVLPFTVAGQDTTKSKHNEQVVIVGSVDPLLNPSYKINLSPEMPELPEVNKDFVFEPINKYFYTPVTFKPIKPAPFRAGRAGDIYNNLVKAGFGSRLSPYAEFFHSQSHKGKFRFDAHLKHISTFGKMDGYSPAPISSSIAEFGFDKFFRYQTLLFDGGYRYNTSRYYYLTDQNPGADANMDDLKQAYNLAFFDVSFKSHYKNSDKLHHSIGLNTYYYFDKHQTSELSAAMKFDFYKAFDVSNMLEYQNLGIKGDVEYYGNKDSLISTTDIYANATPYFKASYGIFRFKAGVNLTYLKADSTSKFRVYPDIEVSINLFPEYLQLYAGVDGGMKKNSYRLLSEENPFISSIIPDSWTNNKIGFFGGLKGNIAKQVGFDLKGSWRLFENDYFYYNEFPRLNLPILPDYKNEFLILNDTGSVFTISAQISYSVSGNLNLFASYEYNSYSLETYDKPFGRMLSQLKAGGSYLIKDKFKPWVEVIYVGKRWAALGSTSSPVQLDSFIDLNLGLDYYHNDHFSGFLKVTNVLNHQYDYYYLHPTYGIEFMLGVGYKF
jgi:hypothetical protein